MSQFNVRVVQLYLILLSLSSAAIPFGSLYLKLDWLAALILLPYGVLLILKDRIPRLPFVASMLLAIYLLLHGAFLGFLSGFNLSQYISYLLQYLLAIFVFITICTMRLSGCHVRRVLYLWVLIACVACLLAIVQKFSGSLLVDKFLFIPYYEDNSISIKMVYEVLAVTAWFSEASWFASFLVVPTLFMVCTIFQSSDPVWKKFFNFFLLLILGIGNILGYSITGTLSLIAGISMMFLMFPIKIWRLSLFIFIIILLIVFFSDVEIIALQIQRFTELISNLMNFDAGSMEYGRSTSFYVRSIGFADGFFAFLNSPLLGHGLGQSPVPYHSGFVTLLAELGLLGAILYFSIPFIAIRKLFILSSRCAKADRVFLLTLIICLFADYTNGLITHNSFNLQRWFLISIIFSFIGNITSTYMNESLAQFHRVFFLNNEPDALRINSGETYQSCYL